MTRSSQEASGYRNSTTTMLTNQFNIVMNIVMKTIPTYQHDQGLSVNVSRLNLLELTRFQSLESKRSLD